MELDLCQDPVAAVKTALEERNKTLPGHIPFESIPESVVASLAAKKHLELSAPWTLVATDGCLERLADARRKAHGLSSSSLGKCVDGDDGNVNGGGHADESGFVSVDLGGSSLVTDNGISALVKASPNLERVSLRDAVLLTEKGLESLARSCPGLVSVNLSGCLGPIGNGFSIFGQYSHRLRKIELSGCRQVTPWAFRKLFEGCTQVEEVDLSYCSLLTDREIQILSGCCTQMKRIDLKECQQISDIGIVALASGCVQLKEANLSRSNLAFRITDAALMALAKCTDLEALHLRGCEMITDAGVSWISEGCPKLKTLDLTGCAKVTNAAMRRLGEGCPDLKSVNLARCKKVSDVGVRYLAEGCGGLESLTTIGLYLLADGIDRDFGFEGLQALAKSSSAKSLRRVNLGGCFQLNRLALRSIASMKNVESLSLPGCTNLSLKGIAAVANSCRRVTNLNLAGCGGCITNEALRLIARGMTTLVRLDVSGCERVGRKGLTTLAGSCPYLRRLNLAGCESVDDDALLALSEGRFTPGLRELDLTSCKRAGNVGLQWLANGLGDVSACTLVLLALKGTSVTAVGVWSVRDRFRYSSVKRNDSFLGFWPLSRWEDRKEIDDQHRVESWATVIQSIFRAGKDRKIAALVKERAARAMVSTRLAARFRGIVGRRIATYLRKMERLQEAKALRLQCWVRRMGALQVERRLRDKRWLVVTPVAATVIQRRFRGVRGRRLAAEARKARARRHLARVRACVVVQLRVRTARANLARKQLLAERDALDELQGRCATKIRARWKSHRARGSLFLRHLVKLGLDQQRVRASKRIVRAARRFRLCAAVERRVERTRLRLRSATVIQEFTRERFAHMAELRRQAEELAALQERSAETMQRAARVGRSRRYLSKMKLVQECRLALMEKKGAVLVRWSRYCLAQRRADEKRVQQAQRMKRRVVLRIKAATKIASAWRGKCGKDAAKIKIIESKQRWKRLWSDKDNAPFYFNRITGESRWRKPQALLDLEPRPTCMNCGFYEAAVECFDCQEIFCSQCSESVHYGGRRAAHRLRALYDYYGRRVDNGEESCGWPTDYPQDEDADTTSGEGQSHGLDPRLNAS